jgi:hypothetical protein
VHVKADGAAVNLAGAQAHEVYRGPRQIGMASRCVCRVAERLERIEDAGHAERRG